MQEVAWGGAEEEPTNDGVQTGFVVRVAVVDYDVGLFCGRGDELGARIVAFYDADVGVCGLDIFGRSAE